MADSGSTNPLLDSASTLGNKATVDFPDPFLDMASMVMPQSLSNILNLCESIWLKNGTYRMAVSRIVRYFITKIEFDNLETDKREKLMSFLNDDFHITERMMLIGDDFLGYGNSFSSVVLPFRRFLMCSKCSLLRPIERTEWRFKNFKFHARCPRCRKLLPHYRIDKRSTDENKINLKRWAPQQLLLLHHPYSQDAEYYWRIPTDFSAQIKKGNPFFVRHTPWEIIQTIQNDQLFKFKENVVYHMKEHTLAGVNTGGWGISRLLSNFAQAWYSQVLKRANEALAQDYIVPMRTITPAAPSQQADPVRSSNLPNFVNKVLSMVKQHRKDPADWNVLPFPADYNQWGGEARALATPQLLDQATDELLNGLGVPAELYRGTLQFQAMPTALRLFQQTWPHLVSELNSWLTWVVNIVCTAQSWDAPDKAYMQPVTMADDIERRQLMLQLASANMVSKSTALAPLGVDPADETRKIFQEQKDFNHMQKEYMEDEQQRELANQYMAGQLPPGAAGPAGSLPGGPAAAMGGGAQVAPGMTSGASVTPQDMMGQAQQLAMQLVQMPYGVRRSEMQKIKDSNKPLHALVKQEMENLRNQAELQGKMMMQQGG